MFPFNFHYGIFFYFSSPQIAPPAAAAKPEVPKEPQAVADAAADTAADTAAEVVTDADDDDDDIPIFG